MKAKHSGSGYSKLPIKVQRLLAKRQAANRRRAMGAEGPAQAKASSKGAKQGDGTNTEKHGGVRPNHTNEEYGNMTTNDMNAAIAAAVKASMDGFKAELLASLGQAPAKPNGRDPIAELEAMRDEAAEDERKEREERQAKEEAELQAMIEEEDRQRKLLDAKQRAADLRAKLAQAEAEADELEDEPEAKPAFQIVRNGPRRGEPGYSPKALVVSRNFTPEPRKPVVVSEKLGDTAVQVLEDAGFRMEVHDARVKPDNLYPDQYVAGLCWDGDGNPKGTELNLLVKQRSGETRRMVVSPFWTGLNRREDQGRTGKWYSVCEIRWTF